MRRPVSQLCIRGASAPLAGLVLGTEKRSKKDIFIDVKDFKVPDVQE